MVLLKMLAAGVLVAATILAEAQTFTNIEIKPARSANAGTSRLRILPNGNLEATSVNLLGLISEGYGVPSNPSERLSGLPRWVYDKTYDIEAKASSNAKRLIASDPDNAKLVPDMFRQILTDRFHLVMRTEIRNRPVYALRVARGGPKLKPSEPSNCVYDTAEDGCHNFRIGFGHPLDAKAVDMDDLTHYIENWTDLPVVNRTSLPGTYIMSTSGWQPMRLPPPPPGSAGDVDFAPLQTIDSILAALGLELHKEVALVPICTVVRIEQP